MSVHQDFHEGQNKFDFDKIIVVCDINNIRTIYEYKYGEKVDFDGYITKFYSTDIFYFSNKDAIAIFCKSQLSIEISDSVLHILGLMLYYWVDNGTLTIRKILKHQRSYQDFRFNFILNLPKPKHLTQTRGYRVFEALDINIASKYDYYFFSSDDFPLLKIIKILHTIFGDFKSLYKAVKAANGSETAISREEFFFILDEFSPLYHLSTQTDQNLILYYYKSDQYETDVYNPIVKIANETVGLRLQVIPEIIYINGIGNTEALHSYFKPNISLNNLASENKPWRVLFSTLLPVLDYLSSRDYLKEMGITE